MARKVKNTRLTPKELREVVLSALQYHRFNFEISRDFLDLRLGEKGIEIDSIAELEKVLRSILEGKKLKIVLVRCGSDGGGTNSIFLECVFPSTAKVYSVQETTIAEND